MSRYDITHNCGHVVTWQIVGPTRDRPRRVAWLEGRDCDPCYRVARLAASKAAGAVALEATADAAMPPLQGTEKQVAWAEQLRAKALVWAREPTQHIAASLLTQAIRRQTDAGWWCDRGRARSEDSARAAVGAWILVAPGDVGEIAGEAVADAAWGAILHASEAGTLTGRACNPERSLEQSLRRYVLAWSTTRGREPSRSEDVLRDALQRALTAAVCAAWARLGAQATEAGITLPEMEGTP